MEVERFFEGCEDLADDRCRGLVYDEVVPVLPFLGLVPCRGVVLGEREMPSLDLRILNEFDPLPRLLCFELGCAEHDRNLKPSCRGDRFEVRLFYCYPADLARIKDFLHLVIAGGVPAPSGDILEQHHRELPFLRILQ